MCAVAAAAHKSPSAFAALFHFYPNTFAMLPPAQQSTAQDQPGKSQSAQQCAVSVRVGTQASLNMVVIMNTANQGRFLYLVSHRCCILPILLVLGHIQQQKRPSCWPPFSGGPGAWRRQPHISIVQHTLWTLGSLDPLSVTSHKHRPPSVTKCVI